MILKTTVTGVEMFRKELKEGLAGENVGVLLRGTKKRKLNVDRCLQSQVRLLHIKVQM